MGRFLSKEHWVALAVIVVTVAVTLMLIALFEEAEGKVETDCFDPTERERVRELAFQGIDKGLVEAVAHLYDVWYRDPNTQQPQRAQVGVTNALNAHARARKAGMVWSPPTCATTSP